MKITDLKSLFQEAQIEIQTASQKAIEKSLLHKKKMEVKRDQLIAEVYEKASKAARKGQTKAYIMRIGDYDFQTKLGDPENEFYYITMAKDFLKLEGIEIDWEYDHDGVGIRSWHNVVAKGWAE